MKIRSSESFLAFQGREKEVNQKKPNQISIWTFLNSQMQINLLQHVDDEKFTFWVSNLMNWHIILIVAVSKMRSLLSKIKLKKFLTRLQFGLPSSFFWWIIVQYNWFNRSAKFQSYRPAQDRVATGQTKSKKSLPCQKLVLNFASTTLFSIVQFWDETKLLFCNDRNLFGHLLVCFIWMDSFKKCWTMLWLFSQVSNKTAT